MKNKLKRKNSIHRYGRRCSTAVIAICGALLGDAGRLQAECTFQRHVWSWTLGPDESGAGASYGHIATDRDDNIYATGTFRGTYDFDRGPGTDFHVSRSPGIRSDHFVTRVNRDGTYGWTRTYATSVPSGISRIVVRDDGVVILATKFTGTVDFDWTEGSDVFVAGTATWRFVTWLTTEGDYGGTLVFPTDNAGLAAISLATDVSNNVFLAGGFFGVVDFNPHDGLDVRSGISGAFVSKFGPDFSYQWTHAWGGNAFNSAFTCAVDSFGDVYVAGEFRGTVDFDPGPGQDFHSAYIPGATFVTKRHGDGSYGWTRSYQVRPWNSTPIAVDTQGYLWLGGGYSDIFNNPVIDLDPTGGTEWVKAESHPQMFITGLTPSGDYAGTLFFPSTDSSGPYGLAADSLGGLLVTGFFRDSIDLNPGPSIALFSAPGPGDYFFLMRLDEYSNFHWAKGLLATPGIGLNTVVIGPEDGITIRGFKHSAADIELGCGVHVPEKLDGFGAGYIVHLECVEPSADADGDGVVDLRDAAAFWNCFSDSGSAESPAVCPQGCYGFDSDHDDDIDLDDYAVFLDHLYPP